MRNLVVLFIHFIATLARLLAPGGAGSIVAEPLLVKRPRPAFAEWDDHELG